MRIPALSSVLAALAPASILVLAAACGDGSSAAVDSTPAPTATVPASAPPGTPSTFGPAPKLGGNVTAVSPEHGLQVKQAATRTLDAGRPGGACFEASFEGTPQYAQWFRVIFDSQEVTTKLTWVVPTREAPQTGKACYAPAEGFAPGIHRMVVSVKDPSNPAAPARQTVGWSFEVTP